MTSEGQARSTLLITPERLTAATRAALLCQFACIACVEACSADASAHGASIARTCLECRESCVALSAAAVGADDVALRAALEQCVDACGRCERALLDAPAAEILRHADVFAKCRARCLEALGGDSLDGGAPRRAPTE